MASQITCITKPDRLSDHEAISNVGGIRGNGSRFHISRSDCSIDIHYRTESYFVQVGADRVVVLSYQHSGKWYIRTLPDDTQRDILLSLPEC